MTVVPFALSDRDVSALKSEYSDAEIVELVYSIARFNSMNRWTDSMGLPQDPQMRGESVEFDTPTSSQWDQGESLVVAGSDIVRPTAWTWQECQKQLKISATRGPRVQLVSKESTAEILGLNSNEVHDWHRAMATLPAAGPEMVRAWTAMLSDPELAPEIKAAICWTTARNNRASSSLAMTKKFADQLKITEQQMQAWESNDAEKLTPGTAQAIAFAKKVTCDPTKITDADIARLREVFSDRQTAHVIYTAATANALDRFTETLALAVPN
jgi:alkylhydroperoxidase family enzyme